MVLVKNLQKIYLIISEEMVVLVELFTCTTVIQISLTVACIERKTLEGLVAAELRLDNRDVAIAMHV